MAIEQAVAHRSPTSEASGNRRERRWYLAEYDPRKNGLNLIRLILAISVIVTHCFYTGGFGIGPNIAGENIGGWAVAGFFVLSGYLISGSRLTHRFGEYLTLRIARIFPAYLVCLLLTAAFFAPIGYIIQNGTIDSYLTTDPTPINYILQNLTLKIGAYQIAGTPLGVPYEGVWNGSLWTLYHEFACYVIIGILLTIPLIRRARVPWLTLLFALSVTLHATMPTIRSYVGDNAELSLFAKLLPFFLGGALVQAFLKGSSLNGIYSITCLAVAVVLIVVFRGWGGQLSAPLIAYFVLWLGAVIPSPTVIRVHDISYGVYIYGFLIEQVLAELGIHHLGYLPYTVLSIAITIPFATISWFCVERPAMRYARRRRTPIATPAQ